MGTLPNRTPQKPTKIPEMISDLVLGVSKLVCYPTYWDQASANTRRNCELTARAVLKEILSNLREPNEEVCNVLEEAVLNAHSLEPGEGYDEPPGFAAWQTGIDWLLEKLEEKKSNA